MRDIIMAKSMLNGEIRCVIFAGEKTFTSTKRGIAPLIELIDSGEDYRGCIAADRIVGKAAALLYVKMGAAFVYAETISEGGVEALKSFGIKFDYKVKTKFIRNRAGNGICPMEQTVADICSPDEALIALKATLNRLKSGQ